MKCAFRCRLGIPTIVSARLKIPTKLFVQHFVLSYVFMFLVACCDVIAISAKKRCSVHFYPQLFGRYDVLLSLPNNVWETYCFCSVSSSSSYYYYYYYYSLSPFFLWHTNLSTEDLRNYWTEFHETWWTYRYMFLVGPKVFSFVVKGVKVIF
jgi:hypothetical protein